MDPDKGILFWTRANIKYNAKKLEEIFWIASKRPEFRTITLRLGKKEYVILYDPAAYTSIEHLGTTFQRIVKG